MDSKTRVRVLGAIDIVVGDQRLDVGGPRQRRLLASLAIDGGRAVAGDVLIDRVWSNDELPSDPRAALRTYVARLRQVLAESDALVTEAPGWRLDDSVVEVDAVRFVELADSADEPGLDVHQRLAALDGALSLWRGDAFEEVAGEDWARGESDRLNEMRVAVVERRYDAMLSAGMHTDALPGLVGAAEAHPLRDRLVGLQMLALFRSGRGAEATRVFQAHHDRLAEDLGLEPGAELIELDRRIVTADPSLLLAEVPGRALQGYRLGEQLGEGTFAVVYRGTQPSVGRDVAVKIIRAELANRPEFVRQFEAEAHLVARLEHPYIVPLYDYWREPDRACLVFRYLRGGTLEQQLSSSGGLSVAECRTMVGEVGAALGAAHAAGVVHRDVKPANVFLDEAGNFYLGDFGIALEAAELSDPSAALSAGSPAYASPEQLRREPIGPSADVHGLGISIYEALTGRLPFPSAITQADLLQRQLHDPIPLVRDQRSEVPAGVDEVLARATAKDPADRFQTVEELVSEFHAVLDGGLAAIVRVGTATTLSVGEARNPYKGLRAFTEADSADFFGRERLVDRLVEVLARSGTEGQIAAVVGPSGIGKSSVVRAGLLPALRKGAVVGSDRWFVATMLPGRDPFDELGAALLRVATRAPDNMMAQLAEDHRGIARVVKAIAPEDDLGDVLLVIDQFEELFTLVEDDKVTRLFLDSLEHALTDTRCPLRVVLTMRADFWDRPLRHGSFARLIDASTINVTALAPDELEQAIVEPAHRTGAEFEPGLVSEIVADLTDQPGALPLLQYALTELWDEQVSRLLTRDAYHQLGGVAGALTQRAEDLYLEATPEEQVAIRPMFGRMVTPGAGAEDTRRRARKAELGTGNAVGNMIARYGDARLLSFDTDPTTREPTIEVAHEALIRQWPRLRKWLEEDREGLFILRHLTLAARGWVDSDNDPAELYRGSRLDTVEEWAATHAQDLASLEQEFLDASRSLREAEEHERVEREAVREHQNRRLRRSLAGVGILAFLAIVASVVAFQQRGSARDQADEAAKARSATETRRLISDAGQLAPTNRRVALLLAAEAYRRDPGPAALGGLQAVLTSSTDFLGYVGIDTPLLDVAWAGDGRLIGVHSGGAVVFDEAGGRELEIPLPGARLVEVRSDDAVIAVAGSDSTVRVFDLGTGDQVLAPITHKAAVTSMTFSADGRSFATGDRSGLVRVFDEQFATIAEVAAHVDAASAANSADLPDGVLGPLAHDPISFRLGVIDLALSADGEHIATVGGSAVRAWDIETGQQVLDRPITRPDGRGGEILSAPTGVAVVELGGAELIVAAGVASVEVWSLSSDQRIDRWSYSGGREAIGFYTTAQVAFDDDLVILASGDGRLALATPEGSAPAAGFDTQLSGDLEVAIDRDRTKVAVAGREGVVVVSLVGAGLISRSLHPGDQQEWFVSMDGSRVVGTTADEQPPQLFELQGDAYVPVNANVNGVSYGWIGLPGAVGLDLRTLMSQERDPDSFAPIGPQYGPHSALVHDVSSDGSWIAIGIGAPLDEPALRVYDRDTGALIKEIDDMVTADTVLVRSVGFSPDSTRLVAATDDGAALVWDTSTWQPLSPTLSAGGGAVVQAQYTPDGRYLVTASTSGIITVRDALSLQPDGVPLLGNTDAVEGFSMGPMFSEDGQWMITTMDGEARIWDLEQRVMIGGPLPRTDAGITNASRNGRFVTTLFEDRALVWDLDLEQWPDIACQAAGRNLTPEEWEQFGPSDEPYEPACSQWPSLTEEDEDNGGES